MQKIILLLTLQLLTLAAPPQVTHPIRFTYINTLQSWSPQSAVLAGLGVPGFAIPHSYNFIALAFWTTKGPVDIAKLWDDPVQFIGPSMELGVTKRDIQRSIKRRYNDAGIRLMVSAFESTDQPTDQDPSVVATDLASWVLQNNLDGVDIDYEDNAAMEASTGQAWLITFQTKLRQLLPDHIISHAPQAPYFCAKKYPKGGYITVNNQVGHTINFYNIQFYNQGSTTYSTYQQLFQKSNGWSLGTSVGQIIGKGIPANKIVVGKPVSRRDVMNTGLVDAGDLGEWCLRASEEIGWVGGVMFWQFGSDRTGYCVGEAMGPLAKKLGIQNPTIKTTKQPTYSPIPPPPTPNIPTNISYTFTAPQSNRINYPVRFVYINSITSWWPPTSVAAGLGVPGYAKSHSYNYIAFSFWTCNGAVDVAKIWETPTYFMGNQSVFGKTDQEIRSSLKKAYNDNGIKILVSAFGSTDMPTSQDPIKIATKLAAFVRDYDLDGCDVNYEDNGAMEAGKGEAWLISFTNKLRELLPTQIITHAPQAPYFKKEFYKNGGYMTIDSQVGRLIDFYNVQFYNQQTTKYDSYQQLFISSTGQFSNTAVKQIIARGVPSNKIIVGKPAGKSDVMNTGFVGAADLGTWATRAFIDLGWYGGVMFWQYRSDGDGGIVKAACGGLMKLYERGVKGMPLKLQNLGLFSQAPSVKNQKNPISTSQVIHSQPSPSISAPFLPRTLPPTPVPSTMTNTINPISIPIRSDIRTQNRSNMNTVTNFTNNLSLNKLAASNRFQMPTTQPVASASNKIQFPIKMSWVNSLQSWWPLSSLLCNIGIPETTAVSPYTILCYPTWTYTLQSIGPASILANPLSYLGTDSGLGTNNSQISSNLLAKLRQKGVKALVSVFGEFEMPTSRGINATICARKLARFVRDVGFDGVDVKYFDDKGMQGNGVAWIIQFMVQLRRLLPNHIICHSIKPQYLSNPTNPYNQIHTKIPTLIDFYTILPSPSPIPPSTNLPLSKLVIINPSSNTSIQGQYGGVGVSEFRYDVEGGLVGRIFGRG